MARKKDAPGLITPEEATNELVTLAIPKLNDEIAQLRTNMQQLVQIINEISDVIRQQEQRIKRLEILYEPFKRLKALGDALNPFAGVDR